MMASVSASVAKQRTRILLGVATFGAALSPACATAGTKADPICAPLKAFVTSVKPHEERKIEFQTAWFSRSTSAGLGFLGKSCDHGNYDPAKVACASLIKHSSTEFAGNNAMRVIACLSPATRFAPFVQLEHIDVEFSYGSSNRGQNVSVDLQPGNAQDDPRILTIEVNGY
jgi:hypothetical protein